MNTHFVEFRQLLNRTIQLSEQSTDLYLQQIELNKRISANKYRLLDAIDAMEKFTNNEAVVTSASAIDEVATAQTKGGVNK